jgi:hypothetical protein
MVKHLPQVYFKAQYPTLRLIHTVMSALGGKAEFDDLVPPWAVVETTTDAIPSDVLTDLEYGLKNRLIKASFLSTVYWRYGEAKVKEALNGRTN